MVAAGTALVAGLDQVLCQVQRREPDGAPAPNLTSHRRKAKRRQGESQEEEAGWAEFGHGLNGSRMPRAW